MTSFELIVVGAGGGPLESNLSAYIFKDLIDKDSAYIGLDAGSGFAAIKILLTINPDLFGPLGKASSPSLGAANVLKKLDTYLVTHAHMDHIVSMVLTAGAISGARKKVVASRQVLSLVENVFQGKLWPDLASWDPTDPPPKYLFSPIELDHGYHEINSNIFVRAMPLSHGRTSSGSVYPSLAYFVRHSKTKQEFLFFGDVEPDSVSGNATTRDVWKSAAPLIASGILSTIFLECSWTLDRTEERLYGHLSPKYFVEELTVLANQVLQIQDSSRNHDEPPMKKRRQPSWPLKGVRVYVTHCKEPLEDTGDSRPIHTIIVSQIQELLKALDLGVEVAAVEQGMQIYI